MAPFHLSIMWTPDIVTTVINTWFDFSNYPPNHANFDNKINHLKPGVFKDETGSIPIQEFIGLRSKMYSVLTKEGNGKRTAKGILR